MDKIFHSIRARFLGSQAIVLVMNLFAQLIQQSSSFENKYADFSGIVMAVYLRNTLAMNRIGSGFARLWVTNVGATRLCLSILS
jgi:hypothetical protein